MPRLANIETIVVLGERQRKVIEEKSLRELASGILDKGLLHPIVLIPEFETFTLVAGFRRLSAVKLLQSEGHTIKCDGEIVPVGYIPYIAITDINEIKRRETELEENILRENLTWQERCLAFDELHKLRCEQNPGHTIQATADEIVNATGAKNDTTRREISQARIVAQHIDDPEIKHSGSLRKAFSAISRRLEGEFLANRKNISKHTFINEDFITANVGSGFTCTIADPGYGIYADKFGDASINMHMYQDDPKITVRFTHELIHKVSELSLPESHFYLFCDIEYFLHFRNYMERCGWVTVRTPIIWSKGYGHIPGLNYFCRTYESIIFASKGKKPLSATEPDLISIPPPKERIYAAQKPAELYAKLIKLSCIPGDRVLDPCCGCGTIFKAANMTGTIATGIDISKGAAALVNCILQSELGDI